VVSVVLALLLGIVYFDLDTNQTSITDRAGMEERERREERGGGRE
jgi:hypothetical protein